MGHRRFEPRARNRKTVTFSDPGVYYYICAPHPWMYGQVIVNQQVIVE